jgi:transposase, IS5 family
VIADRQISQQAVQLTPFPGSFGGQLPMATDDSFRARLDQMIDMRHPLSVLATRMPWAQIEASLAPAFAQRAKPGRTVSDADLFGTTSQLVGAGVSNAGRPRLPIRLMVSLLYLKHAYGLSDQEVVDRWSENVVWQFFSGQTYYEPRPPCDDAQIGRFRHVLGEAGVEQLLKSTIEAAVDMKAIKPAEFERVTSGHHGAGEGGCSPDR